MSNPDKSKLTREQLENLHEQHRTLRRRYQAAERDLRSIKRIKKLKQLAEDFYETAISNPRFAKIACMASDLLQYPDSPEAGKFKLDSLVAICLDSIENPGKSTAQLSSAQIKEDTKLHELTMRCRQDALDIYNEPYACKSELSVIHYTIMKHKKIGYAWAKMAILGASIDDQFEFLRLNHSETILEMIHANPELLAYARKELGEAVNTLARRDSAEYTALEGQLIVNYYLDEMKEIDIEVKQIWDEPSKKEPE